VPNKRTAARGRDRAVVSVDTDQADPKKAVQHLDRGSDADDDADDRQLRQGDDEDGMSEQEAKHSTWLERNRAVNKRLARHTRHLTRQFDQQRAADQAEHQRELRKLSKKIDRLQRTRGDDAPTDAAHEAEMAKLQEQLDAAVEAGESKKVGELTRLIARKEAEFFNKKAQAAMGSQVDKGERRGKDGDADDDDADDDADETPARAKPSQAGLRFTEANDWWDDPDYAVERDAANGIFGRMVRDDGADPKDPKTYARVAKRLKAKFPDLEVVVPGRDDDDDDDLDDDDDDPAERRRAGAPVERGNRDDGHRRQRRGTELSNADLELMRAIGMKPDDNDHLLDMARAAREVEEAERGNRGRR
jgi:hypothetical protein